MVETMRTIIGNTLCGGLIFLAAYSNVYALSGNIKMEVRSELGASSEVAIGRPFTIDVIVEEVNGSIQAPALKGLDGFSVHLSGV